MREFNQRGRLTALQSGRRLAISTLLAVPVAGVLLFAGFAETAAGRAPAEPAAKPDLAASQVPNLLFIMTDQQRWDALSYSGNSHISTPNLDRLAREGAYFANAYCAVPVCAPARAAILTGLTPDKNGVWHNRDWKNPEAGADVPTFDNLLAWCGYYTEYWGKWHTPYKYAGTYDNKVRPLNGKHPGAPETERQAYRRFLAKKVGPQTPGEGEALDTKGRLYRRIPLDTVATHDGKGARHSKIYGLLLTPPETTLTAFTGAETIEALERAAKSGRPFSVTGSFSPPHPPMVAPEPYYGKFPAENLPVPASIDDPMVDSPYRRRALKLREKELYRNPRNVQQMKQIYYGMVAQIDDWIGRILTRLEELGVANNTLTVFTSDHGEMLGDHGLHSKRVFYEGSVHVPLIMWMPGKIPAGTRVTEPVGHYDLFPTILDYLGAPVPMCDGQSLRPLIEGGPGRGFAVSERRHKRSPTVMIRDSRYKLITSHRPDDTISDALYDLSNDPEEMTNLIGRHAKNREANLAIARDLKAKLESWYEQIGSSRLDELRQRELH